MQIARSAASEADLYLACTRADLTRVTDQVRAALDALPVPVVLQDGSHSPVTAGPTLRGYLDEPFREPALRLNGETEHWDVTPLVPPRALAAFPARHGAHPSDMPGLETFPAWGDSLLRHELPLDPNVGLLLRQGARRATPLTPGLAVNLLGAQRGFHPAAAADGTTAVREAWARGLLRPGVADVALLDWARTPSNLAALARACGELAADGLLSVVWPLLDDLLTASLTAPRMLAGTVEVAETVQSLLPAVRDAVASGAAEPTALELPGTRALAAREGSSRAVTTARAVVALLPAAASPVVPVSPVRRPSPAFAQVWPVGAGTRAAVDDGATLTAQWVDQHSARSSSRMLAVDITLPDRPGEPFRVVKDWFNDLATEGQCAASSAARVAAGTLGPDVWLRWDDATGRVVVSPHRNWREQTNGPLLLGDPLPPLTTSMAAVLLASLSHTTFHVDRVLRDGLVGSAAVTVAMRALLTQPDVSPARMVKLLETEPTTLPVLWPVLVESVRYAAGVDGTPPQWLNRVLDVALLHAAHLRTAAVRGLLPAEAATWPGLAAIAARPGTSAAQRKARDLSARLLTG